MFALTVAMLATALAQDHPRLLFGREDVPALRERIKKEPHKSMADQLKAAALSFPIQETAGKRGAPRTVEGAQDSSDDLQEGPVA